MNFEDTLKGGHPNSLGKTIEVVDEVLENPDKIDDLFKCYQSKNETVRLRTSNAFKRIFKEKPILFCPDEDDGVALFIFFPDPFFFSPFLFSPPLLLLDSFFSRTS